MILRRHVKFAGFALAALMASCGPVAAPGPGTLTPVKVCYSALTATQIPVLYAKDAGLFEAEGLNVELTYIESGTSAATAMITGDVDFCQIAGSSVVNAAVAGEDLVILAGLVNTYVYSLVVSPEISAPDQLRGKSVAVSQIGSSSDAAMRAALASFGLDPDKDVTILEVGGQSQRVAALESGQVAGTVVTIPDSGKAMGAGYHPLLDMSTLGVPYQHTAIASTRSYVQNHREVAVAFLRALIQAIREMKSDRPGAMEVIAKELGLDPVVDAELIAASYDQVVPVYLSDVPEPTLEGIQNLLDQAAMQNPAATELRPSQLVDPSVLNDALAGLKSE